MPRSPTEGREELTYKSLSASRGKADTARGDERLSAPTRSTSIGLAVVAAGLIALAAAVGAGAHRASSLNAAVIAPFSGPAANLGKFISLSCYAAAQEINKSRRSPR